MRLGFKFATPDCPLNRQLAAALPAPRREGGAGASLSRVYGYPNLFGRHDFSASLKLRAISVRSSHRVPG